MKELSNPFVVYGYKGATYFCDRESETEKIIKGLSNERNIALIAPRRIGKTGLIHHVFAHLKEQQPEICCIYIDILATKTLEQFVQLLARNVLGRLDFVNNQKEQSLQRIFEYLKDSQKRCYIAIDEFQQITKYPETDTEALLRSFIQFVPNVYFIFAGSKQHLMADMFLLPERPFYQGAQVVNIKEIDERKYYEFASSKFQKRGQQLPEAVFHHLYNKLEGQTWYVQATLNRVYSNQSGEITETDIDIAITELIDEEEVAFENYYSSLTNNQSILLLAIAKEGQVKSPMAQAFISKYHLPALSSIKTALNSLLDSQYIYQYQGAYIVYDRFFGMWLKDRILFNE